MVCRLLGAKPLLEPIVPWGTNFSENRFKIQKFTFKNFVCEIAAILSGLGGVKGMRHRFALFVYVIILCICMWFISPQPSDWFTGTVGIDWLHQCKWNDLECYGQILPIPNPKKTWTLCINLKTRYIYTGTSTDVFVSTPSPTRSQVAPVEEEEEPQETITTSTNHTPYIINGQLGDNEGDLHRRQAIPSEGSSDTGPHGVTHGPQTSDVEDSVAYNSGDGNVLTLSWSSKLWTDFMNQSHPQITKPWNKNMHCLCSLSY